MKGGPLAAAAFVLLVAVGADAAVNYAATTTLSVSVAAPVVQFAIGAQGSDARFTNDMTLSANKTYFTATLTTRSGGDQKVDDVVRVTNVGSGSRLVTLTGSQVTNANVKTFTWTIKNGSTTIGTLDHLASSPTLSFTLPASQTFTLNERFKLDGGSGKNNASISFTMRVASR